MTDTELIHALIHAHREQIGFHDALIELEHRLIELRNEISYLEQHSADNV